MPPIGRNAHVRRSKQTPEALTRRKQRIFRFVAFTLGLVLTISLGEFVSRLALRGQCLRAGTERNFFCVFDAELGWRPKAWFSARHERYGFSVHVQQGEYGLRRSGEPPLLAPTGRRRTVVLGDSYVWGFGVNQQELFTDARCHGAADADLVNLGVSGYGTDQAVLLYERLGERFRADDVALVVTLYNDFENNTSSREYGYAKPYFTLEKGALVLHTRHMRKPWGKTIWNGLRTGSVLFNAADAMVRSARTHRQIGAKARAGAAVSGRVFGEGECTEEDLRALELTAAIIRRLHDRTRAQGRRLFVVFVPYKPHVEARVGHNHPMARLLAEKLRRQGIEYREPYYMFLAEEKGDKKLFNPWDSHFSPAGHAVFARVFVDAPTLPAVRNLYPSS